MILDIPLEKRSYVLEGMIRRELSRYFRLNLNVNMSKRWRTYLKDHFNITSSLIYIYDSIAKNLEFSLAGGMYSMHISNRNTIGNLGISSLAKLLNNGNLEIKGDRLVSDGLEYIKDNINNILFKYLGAI